MCTGIPFPKNKKRPQICSATFVNGCLLGKGIKKAPAIYSRGYGDANPTITILFILTYTYNSFRVHLWYLIDTSSVRKQFTLGSQLELSSL